MSCTSVRRTAAVLATGLSLTGLGGAPAAAAPPTVDVVNLGDSYSAAFGTGGIEAAPEIPGCVQGSGRDHVAALGVHPRIRVTVNAACAGYTTEQVRALVDGEPVAGALAGADLVTMTLGGNDVRWGEFVGACSTRGSAPACDALLAEAPGRIAAAAGSAGRTVSAVDDATGGRVVVFGYPHLFDERQDSALMSAQRAEQLNAWTDALNCALEEAVEDEGAVFVDVAEGFRGHGIGSAEPWILLEAGNPESLHPTERGYLSGYYPGLLSQVARAR